jgi:hypothetical protein
MSDFDILAPKLCGSNAGPHLPYRHDAPICDSVDSSLAWATSGVSRIFAEHGQQLSERFAGRSVSVSTAFSGILTPEFALRVWAAAINQHLKQNSASSTLFKVTSLVAIE